MNKVQPSEAKVVVGRDIKFTCDSRGNVSWYPWDSNSSISSNKELFIFPVKLKDHGYYVCKGHTEEGYLFQGLTSLVVVGI